MVSDAVKTTDVIKLAA